MVWDIRHLLPSEDGNCLGTCQYQGSPSFSFSFSLFLHNVLLVSSSSFSLEAPERSALSCFSLFSPHLPVGACQSHWAAAAGVVSRTALLARACAGHWERGLAAASVSPPVPRLCVGVSLWRTPVPARSTPPCAAPPLSSHGHGSHGRRHFCPTPRNACAHYSDRSSASNVA